MPSVGRRPGSNPDWPLMAEFDPNYGSSSI